MRTMSDYSDYGMHPEIEALTAEHEEMRRLGAELLAAQREEPAASGPSGAVSARLDEFAAVLGRHTVREETGLFATLREVAVDDSYLARFHHDHGELFAAVAAARSDHAQVSSVMDRLEAHLLVEENDMFHGANQLLSADDWAQIERTVAR